MRAFLSFVAALSASFAFSHGARAENVAAQPLPSKIESLSFLVGSYRGTVFGSPAETHFMKPLGGKILGVSRIASADPQLDFAELTRIEEFGDRLILRPLPNGVEGVAFTAVSIEGDKVVFENLSHAFPSRITYRIDVSGALVTKVEGSQGGRPVAFEYEEARLP